MDRIRYLLDEHVPKAVAQALRRRGIDVLTAGEAGLISAEDDQYLARAVADRRILVTHDRGFLRRHRAGEPHAGIAYSQQGSRTIGEIVAFLVFISEALAPDEMAGRVEFL